MFTDVNVKNKIVVYVGNDEQDNLISDKIYEIKKIMIDNFCEIYKTYLLIEDETGIDRLYIIDKFKVLSISEARELKLNQIFQITFQDLEIILITTYFFI